MSELPELLPKTPIALTPSMPVELAVAAWIDWKVDRGRWCERTVKRTGLLDLRDFVLLDPRRQVGTIEVSHLYRYLRAVAHLALATQRSRYHSVCEFLGWAWRRGLVASNPCKMLDKEDLPWCGRHAAQLIGRGKRQLRNVAEVERYLKACNQLCDLAERAASQLPLLTGMRSGEVRNLRAADIDLELGRIWVRPCASDGADGWNVKTAASRRTVGLPKDLRPELTALVLDLPATALLFARPRPKAGQSLMRHSSWLEKLVTRVCAVAGLDPVSPHGLRDTYASLCSELGGLQAPDVGRLLGHADRGRTAKKHYIGSPEAQPSLNQHDLRVAAGASQRDDPGERRFLIGSQPVLRGKIGCSGQKIPSTEAQGRADPAATVAPA